MALNIQPRLAFKTMDCPILHQPQLLRCEPKKGNRSKIDFLPSELATVPRCNGAAFYPLIVV